MEIWAKFNGSKRISRDKEALQGRLNQRDSKAECFLRAEATGDVAE